MTEAIPEDVMKAAREAYEGLTAQCITSSTIDARQMDINAIARAILEERERCAKVALGWYARMHRADWPKGDLDAPDEIAAAIRKGDSNVADHARQTSDLADQKPGFVQDKGDSNG